MAVLEILVLDLVMEILVALVCGGLEGGCFGCLCFDKGIVSYQTHFLAIRLTQK